MGRKQRGFNTPFQQIQQKVKPAAHAEAPPPPPPTPEPPVLDDDTLFSQAMEGVAPLNHPDRVEPTKREAPEILDEDSQVLEELERLVRGEGSFNIEDTGDILMGRSPGVNNRTMDKLRRGKFAVRAHIDLHGYTREEAKAELVEFITRARREDQGCVLVVTGRGKGSPQGLAVLREALPRWLTRHPLRAHVLAFCTAQRTDGGPGAFYVLLRRPGVRPFGV